MLENIHWLGHASFKITNRKVIYIDPYQISGGEKADIILLTHDHFDHLSQEDIDKVAKPETIYVAPPSVTKSLSGNIKTINKGDQITVEGIIIEAVASYNIDKEFHPQSADNVGYIATIDGTRIYFAGDTDVIPEMNDVKADIAFLPCGGTYTMTAKEAAEAAKIIKPKIAVPMHYGAIVGSRADAEEFERLCTDCEVKIMEKE